MGRSARRLAGPRIGVCEGCGQHVRRELVKDGIHIALVADDVVTIDIGAPTPLIAMRKCGGKVRLYDPFAALSIPEEMAHL